MSYAQPQVVVYLGNDFYSDQIPFETVLSTAGLEGKTWKIHNFLVNLFLRDCIAPLT